MIVPATPDSIREAAKIIRSGGLVAFPTETVYGLGANALEAGAVRRIFEAKERPFASPLIVHVANEAMARSLAVEWPEVAARLAARFWPGPLTLVLRKAAVVPDLVTAGMDTVGVRVPAHNVALELIAAAGWPIAAPSANRFSEVSPTTAEHVRGSLGERVELILDGGATQVGIESTVVSLRRDPPAVLRPGIISHEDLQAAAGVALDREIDLPHISESPGLHARHYAPKTSLYLLQQGAPGPAGRGRVLDLPDDARSYAARLYAALHEADAEGWDWIAVKAPPETEEWTGIWDRLRRASAERSGD
jgi:L-threonylcarbamoyladenylate synthase